MKTSVILRSTNPILVSLSLIPAVAAGADKYWDNGAGTGVWITATNWDTGAGANPTASPSTGDNAIFNITGLNTNQTATIDRNISLNSLVFRSTGTTAVNATGGSNRTFTLASGITIDSGAGAVAFGNATNGQQIRFTLGAAQTWANNSSNSLALHAGNLIANGGFALTFGGSGNITAGGVISGTGGLIKSGGGTLTLGAANTFTGDTRIDGGILALGTATTLQTSPFDTSGSGSLSLGSFTSPSLGGLKGSVNLASVVSTGYASMTNLTLSPSGSATYSGGISNGAANMTVTMSGAGTQTLSGTNTFSGGVIVNRGTLRADGAQSLGTGKVTIGATDVTASDHTLRLNGVTIANDVDVKYTYAADYKGAITAVGGTTSTITGNVTILPNIAGAQSRGGHLASDATAGSVLRLMGELNAGGGLTALTQRDGTVEYGGGSSTSYTLGITGTAKLAADNGIGSGVLLNLAVSAAATFDLNGFDTTVAGIQKATAAAVATTITNGATSDSTLTVSSATSYTFAGVIQDGPTNKVNLVKDGSSTLTLSGTNTYTGTTLVSAGTLLITGALGNTVVTVADGATIAGNGSIGAALVLGADARLQLGSTLTVTSATLAAGFDMANIDGLSSSTADGTYTLINGTVDLTGVNHVGLENAYPLGANKLAYFKQGSLQVVVIPEPATAWLGVLGAALLLRRRR